MKLLKAGTTVDESCTGCHQEKRGPYLWEHAPVAEACVTCHDPHGSNTERMLVAKQPFLCQRCHVTSRHPPTVYDTYLLKSQQDLRAVVRGLPPTDPRLELWCACVCPPWASRRNALPLGGYENLDVTDYATINLPGADQPRVDYLGGLTTGYGNRPYTGNTFFARLLYTF